VVADLPYSDFFDEQANNKQAVTKTIERKFVVFFITLYFVKRLSVVLNSETQRVF